MRLCFIGWGDHIHVERWAGYFASLGHQVSVVSLSRLGIYPSGVRQHVLGLERRALRWKILKLRYLLARIRPDIVHAHWAHFSYLAARASARPLVVTIWGSDIYKLGEQPAEAVRQVSHGLRAARLITCDSVDQQAELRRIPGVDETRIRVVQWGVDTHVFRPGARDAGLARELDVIGRPVVLSARHMSPLYNHETVLAAFSLVRRQVPDAVLVLRNHSADPQYLDALERRIDNAGLRSSIRFVGSLAYERMVELYRLAEVTVSVPLSDGTPMSLLEAMACGSAPVVSDLPSLREWIRNGWNGQCAPPNDADTLARHVLRLLKQPELRAAYAQRNLEIVHTRATQKANMAEMEALYLQICRSPMGRRPQETAA